MEALILEYFDGGSVNKLIRSKKSTFSIAQKIDILRQASAGINHLHTGDPLIVHRDIASRNLLINMSQFRVVVSDFGLSRQVDDKDTGDKTQAVVGPVRWMSPESISKSRYSPASDVWAFAVTAWEILAEELPYKKLNNLQVVAHVIMERETLPISKEWPERLSELLSRCWSYEPNDRPTMLDCLNRLMALRRNPEHHVSQTSSLGLYADSNNLPVGLAGRDRNETNESFLPDSWNATISKHAITPSERSTRTNTLSIHETSIE